MSIWFSSDHHFGHKRIIDYCDRPFEDVDEMNEELVESWNALVKSSDTVFYLGDFSMRREAMEKFAPRLNGDKILIAGNHDGCHPSNHNGRLGLMDLYRRYFSDVYEEYDWGDFLLHHMPYYDDFDQRYPEYRPNDNGRILLHGHVHQRWLKNGRQINVGVDVWNYQPVSECEILELAAEIEATGAEMKELESE